jgi:TonB-linked SusC/RagA family outer membrane protein
LKDAASAAIYGSRGASGVILITTKSGRADKTKYNFKTSWGTKTPYKTYDIMTTSEYTNLLYYEASLRFADTGWRNYATTAQINAKGNLASTAEKAAYLLENGLNGGYATDWQQAALRDAQLKNVELSISGGNASTKYYISGAYQNDQGMIKHSEYERFNVRSKVNITLSKKMKLNMNINPSYFTRERPSANFTDFTRVSSYLPLTLNAAQVAFVTQNATNAGLQVGDYAQPRVFNDLPYSGVMPDGTIFTNPAGTAISLSSSANNSPYSILQTEKITTKDYRVLAGADLTYTIIPGLNFKTLVSAYYDNNSGLDFSKSNSSAAGAPSKGVYTTNTLFTLLNENTFTYNKKFGKHSIEALAGFTAEKNRVDSQKITATNFISDNITTLNTALSISQDPSLTYSYIGKGGLLSYLGRINYAYNDKYLLSASIRADGSAKFAPGHKWGYFPSISAGWTVSKEKFLQNVKWVDNLKLRGSYGALGNNNIANFLWVDQLYLANYPTGTGTGSTTLGVSPSTSVLSNPGITWERTFSYNAGLDATLFKNLITIGLDVYTSKTEALLLKQEALGITGVSTFINNIGRMQNNGIELEITSNNIRRKNFRWSTSGNISHVKNKLLALGNETQLLNTGERLDGYLNKVGGPLIQYYGLKTDGIWKSQAEVNAAIASGQTSTLSGYFTPGALKFKDIDGNNIIDLNDRTVIGNPYPDFTWGITNNFTIHNFDLSFTFQGSQGGQLMNGDGFYNEARKYNRAFNDNRWISPANPGDGKTPYFTNGYTNAWTQSDYLITSASYWAVREVIAGYSFSTKKLKRMKLSSARLYASIQNLYYHFPKGYVGINPEARSTAGTYASPLLDGYQRGAFPINRSFLIGLDLNF